MKSISIEITDHDSVCTDYYQVEYKLATEAGYTLGANQFESPIQINQLEDDALYNIRITRFCCDGNFSTPLTFNVTTSELDAPENFAVVQDGADVDGTWDAVAGATNYVAQRADDAGFTTNLTDVYSGAANAFTDTGMSAGTYYYRVKAQATGQPDSDWATDSVIVT